MRHSIHQDFHRGSSFLQTNRAPAATMDPQRPHRYPGKRSFARSESGEDVDNELGRSLKRIRLDGGSSYNSDASNDGATTHLTRSRNPGTHHCMPSPGELCVQRDLQDSLTNQLLRSGPQPGVYSFRDGGTLTQLTSTRFLFSFPSRGSTMVKVSLTIPKRYPHQPPLLSIVSAATALEQQCFSSMIAVSPNSTSQAANTVLWSPIHKLTDVLGWILNFSTVPTERQPMTPKRLSHPSIVRR